MYGLGRGIPRTSSSHSSLRLSNDAASSIVPYATSAQRAAGSGRTESIGGDGPPRTQSTPPPAAGGQARHDARELAPGEPRAADEAHDRAEAPGRRSADEVKPVDRRLEAAAQDGVAAGQRHS